MKNAKFFLSKILEAWSTFLKKTGVKPQKHIRIVAVKTLPALKVISTQPFNENLWKRFLELSLSFNAYSHAWLPFDAEVEKLSFDDTLEFKREVEEALYLKKDPFTMNPDLFHDPVRKIWQMSYT